MNIIRRGVYALFVTSMFLAPNNSASPQNPTQKKPRGGSSISPASPSTPRSQGLTVDNIIAIAQAGLSEEIIIARLRKEDKGFELSPEDMIRLKKANLSDGVIKVMMDPKADIKADAPAALPIAPAPAKTIPPKPTISDDKILDQTPVPVPVRRERQSAGQPEPEYQGTVYWLDNKTNKLVTLERQKVNIAIKVKALGYGGGKSLLEVTGSQSPIRFKSDETPEFVFQASQNVDPLTLAQIVVFTVRKGHRELLMVQSKGLLGFGGVKSEVDKATVPFRASKYNESSIKISPITPLAPGEYGVRFMGMDVYCFGVESAR